MNGAKILTLDIETAPIEAYVFGLFDQNIGLNQIKRDWYILGWAAKWYGDPNIMYMDGRKTPGKDKALVKGIAKLLEEADIIITQNGDKFDIRKINARAIINGLPPIKKCASTDILKEKRKVFGFTSQKLEYTSGVLNETHKKILHEEYPGFLLWREVLERNNHAWDVMRAYCIKDVLSTEEEYTRIRGWIKTQNLATYSDADGLRCKCGSNNLRKKGYSYTDTGKFQSYLCRDCGKRPRSPVNLLSKAKKKTLLREGR